MSLDNLRITKPLSQLPPLNIKTFKIDSDQTLEFLNKFKSICVAYKLHNHTGGTFNYRLNNENAIIDLKSLEEGFENVQIYSIEFINVTDADLIAVLAPISLLKANNALGVA